MDFVKKHARNHVVMVTWANYHYYDFVMNWVTHLRRLNVRAHARCVDAQPRRRVCGPATQMTNFVVGAMDDDLLHKLLADDVPTFAMRSGLTTGDFGCARARAHVPGPDVTGSLQCMHATCVASAHVRG